MPIVAVLGPRQSGKTTLVKELFPNYPYVNLEALDVRDYAQSDPRGFLADYPNGAIFDEAQNVPELFSYLQVVADERGSNKPGQFIITGSQNFLLLEQITQSLAGRIALLNLLPLSLEELGLTSYKNNSLEQFLVDGGYPRLYQNHLQPVDIYPDYIQTYIERDIRKIKNVHDLNTFQRFLKLCASCTGQLLNLSSLANDCGITHNTAKSWISLLETSFIIHLLRPYHSNTGKQLIKSPKLYFYDTGLACSLLNIKDSEQLKTHYIRGHLFETLVISEIVKYYYNHGEKPDIYFWRDKTGNELDCLIKHGEKLTPLEIKSGKTVVADYFNGLNYWNKLNNSDPKNSQVLYGGDQNQQRKQGNISSWRDLMKDTFLKD